MSLISFVVCARAAVDWVSEAEGGDLTAGAIADTVALTVSCSNAAKSDIRFSSLVGSGVESSFLVSGVVGVGVFGSAIGVGVFGSTSASASATGRLSGGSTKPIGRGTLGVK